MNLDPTNYLQIDLLMKMKPSGRLGFFFLSFSFPFSLSHKHNFKRIREKSFREKKSRFILGKIIKRIKSKFHFLMKIACMDVEYRGTDYTSRIPFFV